jgi:hypothetical protein
MTAQKEKFLLRGYSRIAVRTCSFAGDPILQSMLIFRIRVADADDI